MPASNDLLNLIDVTVIPKSSARDELPSPDEHCQSDREPSKPQERPVKARWYRRHNQFPKLAPEAASPKFTRCSYLRRRRFKSIPSCKGEHQGRAYTHDRSSKSKRGAHRHITLLTQRWRCKRHSDLTFDMRGSPRLAGASPLDGRVRSRAAQRRLC